MELEITSKNGMALQPTKAMTTGDQQIVSGTTSGDRNCATFPGKIPVPKLVSSAYSGESSESKHWRRVAEYALMGADYLSLSKEEKQTIAYGAILHDIGLLSVPPEIIKKREALTKEDWDLIRKHPLIGYHLLKGIPFLNLVGKLVLYHHERYDGKGYPLGLKGEKIPIGARLIAVADAFDSMTVKHAYRSAYSVEYAMKELHKCTSSQFCPTAVKAFCHGYIKSRALSNTLANRVSNERIINKSENITTWPITFGQNSNFGTNTAHQ